MDTRYDIVCLFCGVLQWFLFQQMSGLEDAVLRNIEAVSELSNLVRTSFGPNGTRLLDLYARRKINRV